MPLHFGKLSRVASAGLLLMTATVAAAGVSDVIFRLDAYNSLGHGFVEFEVGDATHYPDFHIYSLTAPAQIIFDETLPWVEIANFGGGTLFLKEWAGDNVKITSSFDVTASDDIDTETTFTISTAELSFPTIPASLAQGQATINLNVSDNSDPYDGALMFELGDPGDNIYKTGYNNYYGLIDDPPLPPIPPSGVPFCDWLVSQVDCGPGGSGSGGGDSGWLDIEDDVYNMTSQLGFTLTANDTGGGTFTYEIAPEPASLGLIVLGAIMLMWRRR